MAGNNFYNLFYLIPQNPVGTSVILDLPTRKFECCGPFALKALADTGSTDEYKNDISGLLWWFNDVINAATLTLQKFNDATGVYDDLIALNNNTYGTFYDYGFFINGASEKFIGYQLEWKNVLTIHGAGGYKVKCAVTYSYGGSALVYSNPYCLKQYTADRANITVRVEYRLNHIMGMASDDKKVKDLGALNWYNSLRLPGYFGYPSQTYTTESIIYNNGQQPDVTDESDEEFKLSLKPVPAFVHNIMKIDVMMADSIMITDYSANNADTWVKKEVRKSSEYSPKWNDLQSGLASVEVKFKPRFNNNKKLLS